MVLGMDIYRRQSFSPSKKLHPANNFLPYKEQTSKYFKEMKILNLTDLYRENLLVYFFNVINKNSHFNI